VSGDVAEQAIRFTFGIALARLLSPRDFGLMAMLAALYQLTSPLATLGLGEALVQRQDLTEAHRSSAFWVLVLGGSLLTGVFMTCAPAIAALYGTSELVPLAMLVSGIFVLDAIGSVPRAIVARRLDFRAIARLQCGVAVIAGASAVTLAWHGFGPVSLVADLLITSAFEGVLLFRASAWRPRLAFRMTALRDVLGFGAYNLAARMTSLSAGPMDQLVIGKFLGSTTLGLYARAYNIMRVPLLNVSRSIVRAMFPSLALIQDDVARVRETYVRTTAMVALATVPMCLGFFAAAEPLVVGVFGPQWRETVPILRVLSLAGLVQCITALPNIVFLSQGRPDLQFRLTGLERISTLTAIVIGLHWGVLGVATAYLSSTCLTAVPTLYVAAKVVHLRLGTLFATLSPVLLAGALMTAVVVAIDVWAPPFDLRVRLVVEVLSGILAYWGALRLLRVRAYHDAVGLLRRPALVV
jgi:O-antigen/teichoic acid export membrane protein